MTARDQLRNELLATIKRWSEESDLSVMDALEAMHDAEEALVRAAMNAEEGEG